MENLIPCLAKVGTKNILQDSSIYCPRIDMKIIQHICKHPRSIPENYRSSKFLIRSLVVLVPLLTIPQFWGLVRLRGIQKALANSTTNAYTDNQWTFGQVVAVMIFAPVFTEVGYSWLQERRKLYSWPGLRLLFSALSFDA